MKKPLSLFLAIAALSLSACASLVPPSADELGSLPVVRYGQAAPADGKPFILHYPAGTPLPLEAAVTGSLLGNEDKATLNVSLKQDVYVYKYWTSFDGKTWKKGSDLVSGNFKIALPGETDGRSPGRMSAEFNLR